MAVSTRANSKLSSLATVKRGRRRSAKKTRRVKSPKSVKTTKKGEKKIVVVKNEVKEVVRKPPCCIGCGLRIRDVATVKLFRCRCEIHRTCLIATLESKSSIIEQRCPKCEAWIDYLRSSDDPSLSIIPISHIMPYGETEMPTKGLILRHANMYNTSAADVISNLIRRAKKTIEDLDADELLLDDTYSPERRLRTKNMFDNRREEVNKRIEILRQMRHVCNAGGMRAEERNSEDANAKFNFDMEMFRCIQRTLAIIRTQRQGH